MNNFKLRQRKMPTILKLGAIALFGACMCVPCLKYQDVDKKVFIPPILELNMRIDDTFNTGVIITTISYDDANGVYHMGYKIPMNDIFAPYDAYCNGYIDFNYTTQGNASFSGNWFTQLEIVNARGENETYGNSVPLEIDADSQSSVPLNWSIAPSQNDADVLITYQTGSESDLMVHTLLDVTIDLVYLPNLQGVSRNGGYLLNALGLLGNNPSSYQEGVSYGIQYVLSHLTDYNLYSQQEYLAYGASEYQRGFNASNDVLSIAGFVHEIFKSPVTMFKDIFNWSLPLPNGEVINMLPLMTFLLTIGIALAVVNLILRIK